MQWHPAQHSGAYHAEGRQEQDGSHQHMVMMHAMVIWYDMLITHVMVTHCDMVIMHVMITQCAMIITHVMISCCVAVSTCGMIETQVRTHASQQHSGKSCHDSCRDVCF